MRIICGVDVQDALYNWKVVERIYVGKEPYLGQGHTDTQYHRARNSGRYPRAEAPAVWAKAMRLSRNQV